MEREVIPRIESSTLISEYVQSRCCQQTWGTRDDEGGEERRSSVHLFLPGVFVLPSLAVDSRPYSRCRRESRGYLHSRGLACGLETVSLHARTGLRWRGSVRGKRCDFVPCGGSRLLQRFGERDVRNARRLHGGSAVSPSEDHVLQGWSVHRNGLLHLPIVRAVRGDERVVRSSAPRRFATAACLSMGHPAAWERAW